MIPAGRAGRTASVLLHDHHVVKDISHRGTARLLRQSGEGAIKGHLVVRVRRAPQQAHAFVVSIAVHPRAHAVHGPHILGVDDGSSTALLRGAAIGRCPGAIDGSVHAATIAPLATGELAARAVAPHDALGAWMDNSEVHGRPIFQALLRRTMTQVQLGAIDHLGGASFRPKIGAAIALEFELEGQGESVDQAHVDPILTVLPKDRLKLRIHGRGAPEGCAADLRRTATLSESAGLPSLVAAHLRPIARPGETVEGLEVIHPRWLDSDILRIRPGAQATVAHGAVGDPQGRLTTINDPETSRGLCCNNCPTRLGGKRSVLVQRLPKWWR
mmetsp:Transcript_54319/g.116731  ORF Transcript_54319/g.116731 Transcript_54319/m.116731 type:complete len:329 (+) Transcript_54319:187-1173(+)